MRVSTPCPLEITHFRTHPSTQILGWRPVPLSCESHQPSVVLSKHCIQVLSWPSGLAMKTNNANSRLEAVINSCCTAQLAKGMLNEGTFEEDFPSATDSVAMSHFTYHLGNTSLSKKTTPVEAEVLRRNKQRLRLSKSPSLAFRSSAVSSVVPQPQST